MTARKIVSIQDNELFFHKEELDSILDKYPKHLSISVISVSGEFRTGKSFLMNIFLHILGETENKFEFKSGRNRHTTGIWVWDNLFVDARQDKAIMLMDTQGLFDKNTNQDENIKVFSLTSLISSFQIFNVSKQINESDLQNLALFSEYANVSSQDTNNKPLQGLGILVRDWQHEDITGEVYLKEILSIPNDDSDFYETRDSIIKSYEEIICCLLPYPGKCVHKDNFQLNELDDDFLSIANYFVNNVLNKHSRIKTCVSTNITIETYSMLVNTYVSIFNDSEQFPRSLNILQATAQINSSMAREKSYRYYCQEGEKIGIQNSCQFKRKHKKLYNESLRIFDGVTKIGPKGYYEKERSKLVTEIIDKAQYFELKYQRDLKWLYPLGVAITSTMSNKIFDETCYNYVPHLVCYLPSTTLYIISIIAWLFLILKVIFSNQLLI